MEARRPFEQDARDLVIIGGGLSGTFTLLHLVRELEERRARSDGPIRVAMVDRSGDFARGLPYGRSVPTAFLLNENGATMDLWGFLDWVRSTRGDWMSVLSRRGGLAAERWLTLHAKVLKSARPHPEAFRSMFLPRSVFGTFLEQTFSETLERARRDRLLLGDLITAEAIDVLREEDGILRVELRNAPPLRTRTLLLGLGSLPPDPGPRLPPGVGYVHSLYSGSFDEIRTSILRALVRNTAGIRLRRVLVLGSNASALEFLFALANDPELDSAVDEIRLLSTGDLPDASASGMSEPFAPRDLRTLVQTPRPRAREVWEAAHRDVTRARAAGYTSLDFCAPLAEAIGCLLPVMALAERRRFVERYGMRFTALQYHTSPEYAAAADRLARDGKLSLVNVRVDAVDDEISANGQLTVHASRDDRSVDLLGDVVVNCRGSGALRRVEMPLLRRILGRTAGIAEINASGQGIRVDSRFEASPGVFVLGPLLAGHVSGSLGLWHLESAPRIDGLARHLAATIAGRWDGD